MITVERYEGDRFRCSLAEGRSASYYTYRAHVISVIDGDTLWLDVDCGFRMWSRQKVRLRGIDTPEMGTPEGTRARDFVVREIGKKPFVVVTTTRKDKYARYLADVFYGSGEATEEEVLREGTFLNRALVAGGYAGRYKG